MGTLNPRSSPFSSQICLKFPANLQHAPHIVQGNFSLEIFIMPLYVFECNACGRILETLQSFAAPWPDCQKCDKQMKKKPALTSFKLEGEGWAKDNYGLKSS